MKIVLPTTGCNVLQEPNTIFNYNESVLKKYVIYDGVAHLAEETTTTDTPTGTCLATGDLEYAPETEVYFRGGALVSVIFVFWLVYTLTIKRLIK